MPRTDKQIADYMKYYAGRGNKELQWALENLAKVEGKTPAEIREICEREATKKPKAEKKPRNEGGRPMIPRDEIRAELLAGGTLCSVAEKLGISSTTVGRIRLEMVKEGLLKAGRPYPGRKKDKQPEAYPGQINDDEPEIEDDVKAYVPGEIRTEPKEPTASECKKPEIIEPPFVPLSKALSICDFAVGTFGAGTRTTSVFWDEDSGIVNATFLTADGRLIRITMEVGK